MKTSFLKLLPLVFVLTACPPKPVPDFTISLSPVFLNLKLEVSDTVKVSVIRSGGFDGAITLNLVGDTTKLDTNPVTIPASSSEGTLEIVAHDGAKIGTSFPSIRAVSGDLTHSETLALKVEVPTASVSGVLVKNNAGSKFVPQGIGMVRLEVTGNNLNRVTSAKLGDSSLSISPGQTATSLAFDVNVAHGANLGTRDLILTTGGGSIIERAALTITAITAAPNGIDSSGIGTTDRPYRSLSKALSTAASGDLVNIKNGTYNTSSGEIWSTTPNVPMGVNLQGESPKGVILEGLATANCLNFSGDASVSSLTCKGFANGFLANQGKLVLTDVRAENNVDGLVVSGNADVKLSGVSSEFLNNTGSGISLMGTATLELQDGLIHNNTQAGVIASQSSSVKLNGTEVYANQLGIAGTLAAHLSLSNTKIHDNTTQAIQVVDNAVLDLKNNQVFANTQYGLRFTGKELTVRNSSFHDNSAGGAYVNGHPSKIDFGNSSEQGNNSFTNNNGAGVQLTDARADSPNLLDPIFTISATTLNGISPNANVYVGPYATFNGSFSILGKNNTIQVFAPQGTIPTLSINPSSKSVTAGDAASSFSSDVQNSTAGVNWSISPSVGAGSISPTLGATTLYTPPAAASSPITLTLTASLEGTAITASSTITVAPNTGRLQVNISGLPPNKLGDVTVSGPNGNIKLGKSSLLDLLTPGTYVVTANAVTIVGGIPRIFESTITGSPVLVSAGSTSSVDVSYDVTQTCNPVCQ
jgi:Right handed beta helix region